MRPLGGAAREPVVVLLIDTANVVGSRPTGWWRDRAAATPRLAERVPGRDGGVAAD
jgi:hypothetical protein